MSEQSPSKIFPNEHGICKFHINKLKEFVTELEKLSNNDDCKNYMDKNIKYDNWDNDKEFEKYMNIIASIGEQNEIIHKCFKIMYYERKKLLENKFYDK